MNMNLTLLTAFVETHLGVGDPTSPIWFIGPEPAGGSSEREIAARLAQFEEDGLQPFTSLRGELTKLGRIDRRVNAYLTEKPPIQMYWAATIRIALAYFGEAQECADANRVRGAQRAMLHGRMPALIELSPLPNPSMGQWDYAWTGLPSLTSRATYAHIIARRIDHIAKVASAYKPKVVVALGTLGGYSPVLKSKLRRHNIQFFRVPHPNSRPTPKSQVFHDLGVHIRSITG